MRGRNVVGDRRVDEQGLHRVADTRTLRLRVDDDALGHLEVRALVDVDVAVAVAVDDERDGRVLEDESDEPTPAARNKEVDRPAQPDELLDRLVRVSSTRTTESSGRPALAIPSRSAAAMALFDSSAPADPRNSAAFPDLRHSAAASEVTFGRFS